MSELEDAQALVVDLDRRGGQLRAEVAGLTQLWRQLRREAHALSERRAALQAAIEAYLNIPAR